jgi:hypothetical protein
MDLGFGSSSIGKISLGFWCSIGRGSAGLFFLVLRSEQDRRVIDASIQCGSAEVFGASINGDRLGFHGGGSTSVKEHRSDTMSIIIG